MASVAHLRRWLPVLAAGLATVSVAAGFGVAADELAARPGQSVPQLKTISTASLGRLGLTLSAATLPPYCGAADAAVSRGWLRPGAGACPITRDVAEAAARLSGNGHAVESVLALVTSSATSAVGHNHLTWLVVSQRSAGGCRSPVSAWSVSCGARRFGWTQLVLVDARTAGILRAFRLATGAPQRVPQAAA